MDKTNVCAILEEMGTILELQGANPFKSRAFHTAARSLEGLTEDLAEVVANDRLQEIKGVGSSIASIIRDLMTKGSSNEHDDLRRSMPPGLLDMLHIEGLGPKRIKQLYDTLHIDSIDSLKRAAEENRLSALKGLGQKVQENVLVGIAALQERSGKLLYARAAPLAKALTAHLQAQKGVRRVEVAGSVRRKKEVVGDIDILAVAEARARATVMRAFAEHPSVVRTLARGDTKSSVILNEGIQCDLRLVEPDEFPFALQYFTGSKEHNVELRSRARRKGWSLNEYGFSPVEEGKKKGASTSRPPRCVDEPGIYRALGLTYIEPELREGMGEIEAAERGTLPRLLEWSDLRGTLHCHSTYSDGLHSLEQMGRAAQAFGWEYLGIADHSKAAAYAHGLQKADVHKQFREIDSLNAKLGIRLLKGTECDILPSGELDWPPSVLAEFDYVVVSIHSNFKMSEREMTARIIKGLTQKFVTMLGHPTGRLLLSRDPYPVRMPEVIHAAGDAGKMIEINAYPNRLDLDWRLCRLARDAGVRVSINPDAHSIEDLGHTRFGVNVARKGWLAAADVVNTLPLPDLVRTFRGSAGPSHNGRKTT
jgi:DNA polymerase (family 10)